MKRAEAEMLLNKNGFFVLSSGFRYNGEVLEVSEDTILIKDKFGSKVSLRLNDISVCEVKNGI